MRSMRSKKNIYNRINTLTGTHRQIMRSKMRSTARRCVPKNFSLDKATTPYRIINASPVILSTGRASPRWVPYTASRNRHHVDEESRLDTLKLCKPSIPVYHADVRVWEVNNKNTGEPIGLWYFDPYARVGKRSGAWMNSHRDQQKIKGNVLPIVSNNCNFIKGNSDEPVLISWDDATTFDFYRCQLTFRLISGAAVAQVKQVFEYVAEQVVVTEVSSTKSAETPPSRPVNKEIHPSVLKVWAVQNTMLATARATDPGWPGKARAALSAITVFMAASS